MTREDKIRSLFDTRGFGLEIGPSYNPIVPKSEGHNVEIVDHTTAEKLREKYHYVEGAAERIEDVDFVSDGRSLFDLIGTEERYDYILASHVIEHMTDVIGFLEDCQRLLKPDGKLILAVPDKRYCFDFFRPISTVGEMLQAHREKRARHSPAVTFDYFSTICKLDETITWDDWQPTKATFIHDHDMALSGFEDASKADAYIDLHSWRFTPSAFRHAMAVLNRFDFVGLHEESLTINEVGGRFEFYVVLSKSGKTQTDDAHILMLLKDIQVELAEPVAGSVRSRSGFTMLELEQTNTELTAGLNHSQKELTIARGLLKAEEEKSRDLSQERDAILNSTSWKVTAPLRWLVSKIRS